MNNDISAKEAFAALLAKIEKTNLPAGLVEKIQADALFWQDYSLEAKYVDCLTSIPWDNSSKDILDLAYTKEKLDEYHYGLDAIKDRILEYVSVLSLQENRQHRIARAPIFLFVGLVGTGKTTLAESIAAALNRQFIRIPFGGLGDSTYLRGRSHFNPQSEPGAIIKGLISAKTKNPVILLDEIDRVADEAQNSIMGTLVELLDPEQNQNFTDYYVDYPIDLSQVLFCATCNNTSRIATAVLDRLEPIQMPSYTDEEKIVIGKNYLYPKALAETGLNKTEIDLDDLVWPSIVRPLGFDAGVRTLKRNIELLCRRAAYLIVSGQSKKVIINNDNIRQFIPQW